MQQPKNIISKHGTYESKGTHNLKDSCEVFMAILQILSAPNLSILDFSELESLSINNCCSLKIMDSHITDTWRNHISLYLDLKLSLDLWNTDCTLEPLNAITDLYSSDFLFAVILSSLSVNHIFLLKQQDRR